MGGYNTFCEVLSFDKRTLIVPAHRRGSNNISAPWRANGSDWCAC